MVQSWLACLIGTLNARFGFFGDGFFDGRDYLVQYDEEDTDEDDSVASDWSFDTQAFAVEEGDAGIDLLAYEVLSDDE